MQEKKKVTSIEGMENELMNLQSKLVGLEKKLLKNSDTSSHGTGKTRVNESVLTKIEKLDSFNH
jgi:hypothetical protein